MLAETGSDQPYVLAETGSLGELSPFPEYTYTAVISLKRGRFCSTASLSEIVVRTSMPHVA